MLSKIVIRTVPSPRRTKYTLSYFLKKAREIHEDIYDYSQITEQHIKGCDSHIPIKCKICQYQWFPTINAFISDKSHCSSCATKIWTLNNFLKKAREIHEDIYDYSQITEQHVKSCDSRVPIKCKICQYQWSPTINIHINGKNNCPNCSKRVPWTLTQFLKRAQEIHGDKYDYSQVTEDHIRGNESHVPVKCKSCQHQWFPRIHGHISSESGCPHCARIYWDLTRFLTSAREIHGDKYDYSQVTNDHVKKANSRIPVKCKTCGTTWTPNIHSHITDKHGCFHCAHNCWNLMRLLTKAQEVHGDKYDYSQITEDHIKGKDSHIPIKCKTCKNMWSPSIHGHINQKNACPHCSSRRSYSEAALSWLRSIEQQENIVIQCATSPEGEFKIPSPNGGFYKFDGYHASTNTVYEYYGDYWHGNPKIFNPNDINQITGKTFSKLYKETMEREAYIRSLGFNLIVKWETPLEDEQESVTQLKEKLLQFVLSINSDNIVRLNGTVELIIQ